MSKRASHSDKKALGKGYKYTFELTRKQLFLWAGLVFLGMAWMFTLGVYVGRGLSPIRFDIQDIKKELISLREAALKRDKDAVAGRGRVLPSKPDLDFYEVLTDKKKEALMESARTNEQATESKPRPKANGGKAVKQKRQGLLTVQVASLKNAGEAKEMVGRLKKKGYDAYNVSADIPGKGTYHRVRVGHFGDSSEAGQLAARLKRDNFETIIVRE